MTSFFGLSGYNKYVVTLEKRITEEEFDKFVKEYRQNLLRFAIRQTGNVEDANDAVQDTISKLFRNINKIDTLNIKLFLQDVRFSCSNIRRSRKAATYSLDFMMDVDPAFDVPVQEKSALDNLVDQELSPMLMIAMDQLTSDHKEILLFDMKMQGHPQVEKASVFGIGEQTYKTRIFRARRSMMKYLDRFGVTEDRAESMINSDRCFQLAVQ